MRTFFLNAIVALLMIVSGSFLAPIASAAERPNILFCFADDWGRYASAYGVGWVALSIPEFTIVCHWLCQCLS